MNALSQRLSTLTGETHDMGRSLLANDAAVLGMFRKLTGLPRGRSEDPHSWRLPSRPGSLDRQRLHHHRL